MIDQTDKCTPLAGINWVEHSVSQYWKGVAMSADGNRMVAVGANSQIYLSTDSGTTWFPYGPNLIWTGVAMSADGSRLVAGTEKGFVYVSADGGVSWTPVGDSGYWHAVAISLDGHTLAALSEGDHGNLMVSRDFGASWTVRENARHWTAIAMSADGAQILAAYNEVLDGGVSGGGLRRSTDFGVTWAPTGVLDKNYLGVACSADGTKLVAVVQGYIHGGSIYLSKDSGTTWSVDTSSSAFWSAAAMSWDGSKIVAVSGDLTLSWNAGANFFNYYTINPSNFVYGDPSFYVVAMSADGTKLLAADYDSRFTRHLFTSTGPVP
jgi:photosystem II stability/assembly factor-like uncharacterized protein